jgi:hypothetical protein
MKSSKAVFRIGIAINEETIRGVSCHQGVELDCVMFRFNEIPVVARN